MNTETQSRENKGLLITQSSMRQLCHSPSSEGLMIIVEETVLKLQEPDAVGWLQGNNVFQVEYGETPMNPQQF